jgi:uncharacterized protein YhfF
VDDPDPRLIETFWRRFTAACPVHSGSAIAPAWCFGDSPEMADELLDLVITGPKRATAGALADHVADDEPVPRVGDLSVLLDGSSRPRAVIMTTDVRIGPLSSVDDQFAWDEGEGDRSRTWWLDAHTRYFERWFARVGRDFHADIDVVFERFELVYHEP